ncbi:hypothetical protein SAMN02745174_02615 [Cetobacterium ceti]|uniref:Conjugal transfer protein TraD n=1 Tax=Cetobacterium ceti TaxID=180163 RepID=A0A1T4R9D1_9FUSO|nr:hypothetical protein [Cetobacterium ceti]SKA12231.1 hypothetical protein SAMN02745174_02615 [Cetobacterium ceti]
MKIKELNRKLENINNQLRSLRVKKSNFTLNISLEKRKKRVKNLIVLGANFEILGYEKENTAVILGFLKENLHKIEQHREYYKNIGEKILEDRKNNKKTSQDQRQINSEELKELLVLSKNYNVSAYIQTEFKKTLWETLTVKEFSQLKKYFLEN